jgi:hypothetical protein
MDPFHERLARVALSALRERMMGWASRIRN